MPDGLKVPFIVPKEISSLMPAARQSDLSARDNRFVSMSSNLSNISHTCESAASEFLNAKIASLEDEKSYMSSIRDGLVEITMTGHLENSSFQNAIRPVLRRFRTASQALTVMKRQKRLIQEDLEAEVEVKRSRAVEPLDNGLLERAYMDAIVPRVMGAAAKTRKSPLNQSKFKKEVGGYYGLDKHCQANESWCHVLGFPVPSGSVKAAHLVPKSLSHAEVSHIFGVEDGVLTDPRNGILLFGPIESLLDQGVIAIVPIPGATSDPIEWKCIVLDETKNQDHIYTITTGEAIKVKDLDGRELIFLSDARPRRRYLYFRFLLSYLNSKRLNLSDVSHKLETKRVWTSAGEYLNKSTLKTLARCVSGCELPDEFVQKRTFEVPGNESRDIEAGTVLGADIQAIMHTGDTPDVRDGLVESLKQL